MSTMTSCGTICGLGSPAHLALIPAQRPQPTHGWRHLVLVVTFGLVNLGQSARERREAEYEAAIQAVLRGNYKVGVLR